MKDSLHSRWTRRDWLASNARTVVNVAAIGVLAPRYHNAKLGSSGIYGTYGAGISRLNRGIDAGTARVASHAERIDPGPLQAFVQCAVDAARSAGASYADARITRSVRHFYSLSEGGRLGIDEELIGVGVRALVNGYWGFVASPYADTDEVVRMARDAVAQAKDNGVGSPRTVELGHIPVATGTWTTPIRIDPFTVSIEEKFDHIVYWKECAEYADIEFYQGGGTSWMQFVREERVVATSEGSLFTQTLYESGGEFEIDGKNPRLPNAYVHGIEMSGKGWELFLDAKIPEQMPELASEMLEGGALGIGGQAPVGRYTLVCSGKTMARLLNKTLGVATQLDRALGYEANAGGTSYIDDPLAMVGHLQVASPLVNVTTNRSAPAQLATVKWDDEGVEPPGSTLVKDGVLTDFQTTREQSGWLEPYYQSQGRPVSSNGCAASDSALAITMQHVPNLSMEPSKSETHLQDLVSDVKAGIYIDGGWVECDHQVRNGRLGGKMQYIRNGRLGLRTSGAVSFNTLDIWTHIVAIGGQATIGRHDESKFNTMQRRLGKGQPLQFASHSVRAVAATILNQPVIDPTKV